MASHVTAANIMLIEIVCLSGGKNKCLHKRLLLDTHHYYHLLSDEKIWCSTQLWQN